MWLPPSGGRSELPWRRYRQQEPLAQLTQPLEDDQRRVSSGRRLLFNQDPPRRRDREHAGAGAIEHDLRLLGRIGPDTRPPFVYNLATVFGCIGPRQTTTSALASVVDPGDHLAAVELVYVDTASGAETRKRMTAYGGAFDAPIGPYTAEGTITWQVIATDEAGNSSSGEGPSVAASATC